MRWEEIIARIYRTRTRIPIGELQGEILSYVWSEGFERKRFKLSSLKHLADRKRVYDAVKRLERRGLVRHVSHGWYEVLISPKDTKIIIYAKAKLSDSAFLKTYWFRASEELMKQFTQLCHERKMSVSECVRKLIEKYVEARKTTKKKRVVVSL